MSARDLVDEAIAAGCLEWVPDDLSVRAKPKPSSDAVRLAEMIVRAFDATPLFGTRVITLREDCNLHAEAKAVLRAARRPS